MNRQVDIVGTGRWARNIFQTCESVGIPVGKIMNRSGIFPDWVPEKSRSLFASYTPSGSPLIVAATPELNTQLLLDPQFTGTPLFLEKPGVQGIELVGVMSIRRIPAVVNYVMLFSSAFQFIKSKLQKLKPGQVHFQRVNVGDGPQRGFSALWDYGPHEMSLYHHLGFGVPGEVHSVSYANDQGSVYEVDVRSVSGLRFSTVFGNMSGRRQNFLRIISPDMLIEWDCVDSTVRHNGIDVSLPVEPGGSPLSNSLLTFMEAISDPHQIDVRFGWPTTQIVTRILEEVQRQTQSSTP